jgi:hypothetical protein
MAQETMTVVLLNGKRDMRTPIDCPFDQSKCKEEEKILGYYKMTQVILEGCFSFI